MLTQIYVAIWRQVLYRNGFWLNNRIVASGLGVRNPFSLKLVSIPTELMRSSLDSHNQIHNA